eukprot:4068-Amphidinium_carterae.1
MVAKRGLHQILREVLRGFPRELLYKDFNIYQSEDNKLAQQFTRHYLWNLPSWTQLVEHDDCINNYEVL